MLIEIHMIQNHSPSNLNRDDLGVPKTCVFGGVTRARISSQCLKRSIRRSEQFQAALERDGGIRTRSLVRELARRAHGNGEPPKDLIERVRKVFEDGGVPFKEVKGDPDAMKILFFVPESDVQLMADGIRKAANDADLADIIAPILRKSGRVPDIGLSGRMTEFDAKGALDHINFTVEAALQAAHAISTHAVVNEVDYWTAADDLPSGQAAAMVEEATFNSACFYKYFCVDWDQLVENLGNDDNARKLAACTLGHFIRAASMTTPSGKQNSFASHTEPCGILVEIKLKGKHPTSYANAFAEPARKIGDPSDDAPDCVSLVGRSIAQLGDHVYSLRQAYRTDSTLLWYSDKPWRYPLQGWERQENGRKAKKQDANGKATNEDKPPVPLKDFDGPAKKGQERHRVFPVLGGNGGPQGLIEAVIEELGLGIKWADVINAGKKPTEEAAPMVES